MIALVGQAWEGWRQASTMQRLFVVYSVAITLFAYHHRPRRESRPVPPPSLVKPTLPPSRGDAAIVCASCATQLGLQVAAAALEKMELVKFDPTDLKPEEQACKKAGEQLTGLSEADFFQRTVAIEELFDVRQKLAEDQQWRSQFHAELQLLCRDLFSGIEINAEQIIASSLDGIQLARIFQLHEIPTPESDPTDFRAMLYVLFPLMFGLLEEGGNAHHFWRCAAARVESSQERSDAAVGGPQSPIITALMTLLDPVMRIDAPKGVVSMLQTMVRGGNFFVPGLPKRIQAVNEKKQAVAVEGQKLGDVAGLNPAHRRWVDERHLGELSTAQAYYRITGLWLASEGCQAIMEIVAQLLGQFRLDGGSFQAVWTRRRAIFDAMRRSLDPGQRQEALRDKVFADCFAELFAVQRKEKGQLFKMLRATRDTYLSLYREELLEDFIDVLKLFRANLAGRGAGGTDQRGRDRPRPPGASAAAGTAGGSPSSS